MYIQIYIYIYRCMYSYSYSIYIFVFSIFLQTRVSKCPNGVWQRTELTCCISFKSDNQDWTCPIFFLLQDNYICIWNMEGPVTVNINHQQQQQKFGCVWKWWSSCLPCHVGCHNQHDCQFCVLIGIYCCFDGVFIVVCRRIPTIKHVGIFIDKWC